MQRFVFICSIVALTWSVRGDTIWIGEAGKNPIRADVTITGVTPKFVSYNTQSGLQASKPVTQVQQLAGDGETAFNAAEQAFADGKFPEATDQYRAAARQSAKVWVKERSGLRLMDLSAKLSRFDAAVTGYVALVQVDPDSAAAVGQPSPAGQKVLDPAIGEVKDALATKLDDNPRRALLNFSLELYRAKGDAAMVTQTIQQLAQAGAASSSDLALLKISTARSSLASGDFAGAADQIQQNRALFTDPQQQVEALLVLAQASEGTDGGKDDPAAQKDLAITYMRVATMGKDLPGQPHVADALLKTAQIEEKIKEPQVALELYQQIARDYAGQPAGLSARSAADRLSRKS